MRIGFLGGDERMLFAAACAADDGHTVALSCLPQKELPLLPPEKLFSFAQALILPLPAMKDGLHISGTALSPTALSLSPGTKVFGGVLTPALYAAFPQAYDYYRAEELLTANARLTAEGAVATALRATGRGFYRTDAAVIGYGRIGKCLAAILRGFGVPVTVYVRRAAAAREAEAAGFSVRPMGPAFLAEREAPGRHSGTATAFTVQEKLIFGTVPAPVFGAMQAPGALHIFDLGGGMKGGVPLAGVPVSELRGVPGVFAPAAAGEIIYRALSPFLRDDAATS